MFWLFLLVCLSVLKKLKNDSRILMQFSGNVENGQRNRRHNFCGDPDHCKRSRNVFSDLSSLTYGHFQYIPP